MRAVGCRFKPWTKPNPATRAYWRVEIWSDVKRLGQKIFGSDHQRIFYPLRHQARSAFEISNRTDFWVLLCSMMPFLGVVQTPQRRSRSFF
jgi:hypothetical protein